MLLIRSASVPALYNQIDHQCQVAFHSFFRNFAEFAGDVRCASFSPESKEEQRLRTL